ncbi:MAG: AzlC family ABC transporter permease [Clostridiales bacterium]
METSTKHNKILKAAIPHTIPVFFGYIFMGIAFGILLTSKGYSFGWAFFMALTMFAGTGQFVAINMLLPGYSLIQVFIMELMVNARHIFYGLSLLEKVKDMGWQKFYIIFGLTDETYALLSSAVPPQGINPNKFRFLIAVLNHSYWIIGCTLGGLVGSLININTTGIDFVMTALFTVIAIDQWHEATTHLPAIIGVSTAFICLLIFGANNFLIPALLIIMISLTLCRKKIENKKETDISC